MVTAPPLTLLGDWASPRSSDRRHALRAPV